MRVSEIMSTGVVTVSPGETESAARSRMKRRNVRHLVVTENSDVVGVLSERDLKRPRTPATRKGRTVRDLMASAEVSAEPETTLENAANLMQAQRIGCLPVMERGRLMGIVTATDVLDELGRESRSGIETPESRRRAPFPHQLPRAIKRVTGRAKAPLVPAHVRVTGVQLSAEDRAEIRRKLGTKLGKFAASIERVSVRVKDVNGPRGGIDQQCRIKVVLAGLPSVIFENQDASLEAAIAGALAGAEREVRKNLRRRRMKPIKARTAGTPV